MRQSSSQVISPAMTSAASIHPILQAALENLDVQLEEELTRYRRQQRLQPDTRRRKLGIVSTKPIADKAVQLPQFPLSTPLPIPSAAAATPSAPIAPRYDAEHSDKSIAPRYDAEHSDKSIETAADPVIPAVGSREAIADETPLALAGVADLTPIAATAAPLPVSSAVTAEALQPLAPEPAAPEDYFASSEELLRSIAEEELQQADMQPTHLLNTLLTPLGIGSLLLLLLSTATLGYLVMNPATLGFFVAQKPSQGLPVASVPTTASPDPMRSSSPAGVIAAPSPDLAAKEFVDLNLNSLSTLPKPSPTAPSKPPASSPSPSPQAAKPLDPIVPPAANLSPLPSVNVPSQPAVTAPAPVANPRPAASSPRRSTSPQSSERSSFREPAEQSTPAVSQPPAPAPEAVRAPAPRAASRTPEVAANPSPARSSYYYVVAPYRSDSELNQVQQSVPDAYVRNFSDGAKVQMGAFSDESKAQERVQELQQQGIQAEIRQPE